MGRLTPCASIIQAKGFPIINGCANKTETQFLPFIEIVDIPVEKICTKIVSF